MLHDIFAVTIAYLLGCCNTGYYLVRWMTGQDIRTVSSGTAGSRNVGRLLGTTGFIVTLAGDAGKGALAVWIARSVEAPPWLACAVLMTAVAGHIWPVQLGFRGGKGFATFAGGMILLKPLVLLAGLALCLLLYPFVRGTTKTGLIALAFSPVILTVELIRSNQSWFSAELAIYCLMVVMVLYAHRSNIRKEFFRYGANVS